ncbi:hypothetical protein [Hydrogenophaga sp.]|uniref:P-type ATPase n=1 Tax=Hydrogenophaga sp. TaxID=1904254 RepID=UPI003BB02728
MRGELRVLHEGDRIATDALLIEGLLETDESLLTGEAVPMAKLPAGPDEQTFASMAQPAASAMPPQARPARFRL